MSIFQIFASLFALFMLYWVRSNQKRGNLSAVEASFWLSVWAIFIILSLFPNLLLGVANLFHFARVFDLLVVGAFMVITILFFQVYLKSNKTEKKLERIVREHAIKKVNK
ncbi:hypothetical protein SDC9_110657 [bioreactor metagenome]|uniref:DUF2304 domain-containing protein n=1 Tax=bioreactor metagenome TaxID=1076179 RepID=A0A645BKM1_9ZZZZ